MTFRRWAILGIALACVGANLVYFESRPPAKAPVDAGAASCEALAGRYASELTTAQRCSADADCIAEKHDEVLSGLGGCVRARNADAGLAELTRIENDWKAAGCAKRFATCAPHGARCLDGICRELPPDGIPPGWERHEHIGHTTGQPAFSLWLPPGSKRVEAIGDDGEIGAFETPGIRLDYELDSYAPLLDPNTGAGDVSLGARAETIAGVQAHFRAYRMPSGKIMYGVRFDPVASIARVPPTLSLFAWCADAATCAEVWTIGRGVQFH